MTNNHSAYPEFLERSDLDSGTWDVRPSGVPRTDITNKTMLVPVGADDNSRAIRARELMRAKVSPPVLFKPADVSALVTPQIMDACETVRLNTLLKHSGVTHNADKLDNRGVTATVDRAVASRDINALVELTIRTHGTRASKTVAAAVRTAAAKHNLAELPDYMSELRRVIRYSTQHWSYSYYRRDVADTDVMNFNTVDGDGDPTEVEGPSGYRFTYSLASRIDNFLQRSGNPTTTIDPKKKGNIPEEAEMPRAFARLILEKLPLTERVAGRMGRKRSATNVGINPRRIHRYLVDPEKRIFDRRIKGIGGVVLIDQSGSMSLSTANVWEIIKASPGCTIIGYSDDCQNIGTPNCWVLAENGKVVSEVRDGNGGNGVDGPALLFALSKRKKGEPIIWVCDGYVTGSGDGHQPALASWCAKVVINHDVHMVEDVPSAISALKQVRDGRRLPMQATGPVDRAVTNLLKEDTP